MFWSVLSLVCFRVFKFQNICLKNISLRVSVCSVYVRAFPVTSKGNNPIFNFDQSYDLNFKTLLIYFKTFNILFKITKLFFRKLAIHLKRFKYFETNYNCNLSRYLLLFKLNYTSCFQFPSIDWTSINFPPSS